LFRASLGEGRRLIPLADELDLCRRYLQIEQLRLGERLRVQWEIGTPPPEALVPPLTLQPLVENAVYHGIEPLPDGGTIRIRGYRDADTLTLEVENPRPDVATPGTGGHRMAVENIRERLALHFGNSATMAAHAEDGRYRLQLTLPLRKEATGP
jgi:two-component system sensor histidine kinase AlgZ